MFRSTTMVKETYRGQTVWDGPVYIFDLLGHPMATRAYGLICPVEGTDRTEFVVVLDEHGVVSPEGAVRAYVASKITKREPG